MGLEIFQSDYIHLSMPVDGEDQARHFYGDLLGFEERSASSNPASRRGMWFRRGSLQLHLGAVTDWPAKPARPTLTVDDLHRVLYELVAEGFAARLEPEPWPGFACASAVDPFGNRIALMQASGKRRIAS